MRSKNSPDRGPIPAWPAALVALCLVFSGCAKRDEAPKDEPKSAAAASKPGPSAQPTPDPAPKKKKKPKRRRLPAPLGPQIAPRHKVQNAEQRPCMELVHKVCALLSEGAEECGEARHRVERRPGTVSEDQCARALDWYLEHVESARRVRPCSLLAERKCKAFGAESTACVNARADADHLAKRMGPACLADLLLFEGMR